MPDKTIRPGNLKYLAATLDRLADDRWLDGDDVIGVYDPAHDDRVELEVDADEELADALVYVREMHRLRYPGNAAVWEQRRKVLELLRLAHAELRELRRVRVEWQAGLPEPTRPWEG
jgi:hypothetical protein